MTFFDKIYISSYHFFKKREREDSRFAATCILIATQIAIFFSPLLFLKIIFRSTFLSSLHQYSKLIAIPIMIFWIYIVFRHYNRDKTQKLLEDYNYKSKPYRRFWNLVPFIILTFFLFFLFFLVILNQRLEGK
jgi:hypothetical protein